LGKEIVIQTDGGYSISYWLEDALEKTGMSKETASVYVFHGWRHFFTAYMRDKLNEKLLQSQTGHRTISMLDHYSGRSIAGDREKVSLLA
jgi:integrase